MDVINNKSDEELHRSLLAEIAKASNEIRCARTDLQKATNRLQFCIAVINDLLDRKDQQI